jgi:hypothetical protein
MADSRANLAASVTFSARRMLFLDCRRTSAAFESSSWRMALRRASSRLAHLSSSAAASLPSLCSPAQKSAASFTLSMPRMLLRTAGEPLLPWHLPAGVALCRASSRLADLSVSAAAGASPSLCYPVQAYMLTTTRAMLTLQDTVSLVSYHDYPACIFCID